MNTKRWYSADADTTAELRHPERLCQPKSDQPTPRGYDNPPTSLPELRTAVLEAAESLGWPPSEEAPTTGYMRLVGVARWKQWAATAPPGALTTMWFWLRGREPGHQDPPQP